MDDEKQEITMEEENSENHEAYNEESEIDPTLFYEKAKSYWGSVPATVDGMLGGCSHVASTDIGGSMKFLKQFVKSPTAKTNCRRALDCGAGIGRITKRLLLPLFDNVDLVEMNQEFLNEAPNHIGEQASRVERYICCGLQDFTPEVGRYDVIWCQWVLGHLKEDDLVCFLQRAKAGLASDGIIVIKENTCPELEYDKLDSSYSRTRQNYIDAVNKAGLTILKETKQQAFPKDLFEVRMFAVQ